MKIIQFSAFGSPGDVVECLEVADPGAPGDEEVIVDVEAFPINPADLLLLEGGYAQRPPLPARVGAESTGRIAAAGAAVQGLAVGDRVIVLSRDNWCQRQRLHSQAVVKVPGDLDPLQLAMLKVNPATAWMMLRDYVELEAGDWVIQNAANSGVGRSLIGLAKAKGIRTVNIVRRAPLIEELTALGADLVFVDGDDLAERVNQAVGERQIKLAIDAVAGPLNIRMADCLAEGATLVNYGLLSGLPCQLRADQVVFQSITLTGFWLAKKLGGIDRAAVEALYGDLAARVRSGELHVPVEATYEIEEIAQAVRHAHREGRGGKVLVTPNGPVS